MSRHRSYCFTLNNPGEWTPDAIYQADKTPQGNGKLGDGIRFLAGQFERGSNGTLHFQGYVVFRNPQGLPGAKRLLQAPTAHFEPRKGTHEQALSYVHKAETRVPGTQPYHDGDEPEQGKRGDLDAIAELVRNGATESAVADAAFGTFVRYHRGISRAIMLRAAPRDAAPQAAYYWGASGSGKSYAAWHHGEFEKTAYYGVPLSSGSNVWFDGYVPGLHKVVIFDDYYHNFRFSFLLQLLDEYPFQVPYKGGHCYFNSPIVILTSNIGLHEQYPKIPDQVALWRRFGSVVYFETGGRRSNCSISNPLGDYVARVNEE